MKKSVKNVKKGGRIIDLLSIIMRFFSCFTGRTSAPLAANASESFSFLAAEVENRLDLSRNPSSLGQLGDDAESSLGVASVSILGVEAEAVMTCAPNEVRERQNGKQLSHADDYGLSQVSAAVRSRDGVVQAEHQASQRSRRNSLVRTPPLSSPSPPPSPLPSDRQRASSLTSSSPSLWRSAFGIMKATSTDLDTSRCVDSGVPISEEGRKWQAAVHAKVIFSLSDRRV